MGLKVFILEVLFNRCGLCILSNFKFPVSAHLGALLLIGSSTKIAEFCEIVVESHRFWRALHFLPRSPVFVISASIIGFSCVYRLISYVLLSPGHS